MRLKFERVVIALIRHFNAEIQHESQWKQQKSAQSFKTTKQKKASTVEKKC